MSAHVDWLGSWNSVNTLGEEK